MRVEVTSSWPAFFGKPRYRFGADLLHIYGREGLVRGVELGDFAEPPAHVFFASNGSYSLFGFEILEGDGTPAGGKVFVFRGADVVFNRTFLRPGECMCYVIHGWGMLPRRAVQPSGSLKG